MKKKIIFLFILTSSCITFNDEILDFSISNEKYLLSKNINFKNVIYRNSFIDIYLNNKLAVSSKCIININKKRGAVISVIPYAGYEIFRIIIDGKYLYIIDREKKEIYEERLFENFKVRNEIINDIYYSLFVNNYNKRFKSIANITENGNIYTDFLNNSNSKFGTYIYVNEKLGKIKEITHIFEKGVIVLNYFNRENQKVPEKISVEFNNFKYNLKINVRIENYEIKKERNDIFNMPEEYKKVKNFNLNEFIENL